MNRCQVVQTFVAGALLGAASFAAGPDVPLFGGTGSYTRPGASDLPGAQRYFDQGLALLWGYYSDDARRSFQAAAEIDPQSALAWWGIAAACGPNINYTRTTADCEGIARDALVHARELADRAAPADRALIEAQSVRFAPEHGTDRAPQDRAYADAMRAAWRLFPGDADVGALFAEALMDVRPWDQWTTEGEPQPGTLEIVEALERVLELSPDHPLGLHLYLHAFEGSPDPARAAMAADRLRELMPGVGHFVHMPSHIDVLLGRWDEAVASNERAVAADAAFVAQGGTLRGTTWTINAHHRHMLAFAAMMTGRSEVALTAVRDMVASWPPRFPPDLARRMDAYAAMPLEILVRFGRWDEILAAPLPDESLPIARALGLMARGVARAAQSDTAGARVEQTAFRAAVEMVPTDAFFWNSRASAILDVAEALLDGEILFRELRFDDAIARLGEAASAEAKLPYDEPPDWILPTRHALGAALMTLGRGEEAEAVYRADLVRWPGNGWSLFGLAQSLRLQGKDGETREAVSAFERAWHAADFELHSSCLCLPGV